MSNIKSLLSNIRHRPYPLPKGEFQYYQEWNRAVFLHWKVDYESLRKLVPEVFNLDQIDGDYYISIVAFTMEKIRPRLLPSLSFLSNFDEVNTRTYIDNDGKKGVFFINIEGQKLLSCLVAKELSGLPYQKANMKRSSGQYDSQLDSKNLKLHIDYNIGNPLKQKTNLDLWLTERYCLYLQHNGQNIRYDIHHKEWEINDVKIESLETKYKFGNIDFTNRKPDLTHYSKGVEVISWKKVIL